MLGSLKGYFVAFAVLFVGKGALAQEIKVVDRSTSQPIPDVVIFNPDKTRFTSTNAQGLADISEFAPNELIEFQHPSYQNIVLPADEVSRARTIRLVEAIIKIDEVIISANKWEQVRGEVPNEIVKLTSKDIQLHNPQTAADALQITGQVFIQKSQLGGGSPMIRGFAANSVLITVDGVRMNNAIFRSGNLQNVINIDPNALESAEVVLGPGSVIYGSDALGGVMNFSVKKPQFMPTGPAFSSGIAYLRYSSANTERTSHLSFNLGGKKISWYAAVTYSLFDDLRTGSNRDSRFPDFGKRPEFVQRLNGTDTVTSNPDQNLQVPSGYNTFSTIQRLNFQTSSMSEILYSFYLSTTTDIPRYDRLIEYQNGLPRDAEWYYGPQKWMMNSIAYSSYKPRIAFDQMKLIMAFQRFDESRNERGFQDSDLTSRKENVNAYSINLDFDKSWNQDHLYYGLEVVHNQVGSEASVRNIETGATSLASTRYPDGGSDMTTLAAYGSYKRKFSEKTILNVGVRLSDVSVRSTFEDKTFFSFPFDKIELSNQAITGNAGLVVKPGPGWELDLMVSSGFRSPNVDDIGKVFDSEPGNVVVPNPNLLPEYTYNSEVSISKTIEKQLTTGVTGFYTYLDNALVRRDFTFNGQDSIMYDGVLSRVQAEVNTGEAIIYGVSGFLNIVLSNGFSFSSHLTWTDGKDPDGDIPLRHTTPLFGRTGLLYREKDLTVEFYSRYQGSRAFADLAPSEQNKTHLYTSAGALGWATLNLTSSWQVSDHLRLTGSLENILDTHYRPYSSGISAPGRNFVIALMGSL